MQCKPAFNAECNFHKPAVCAAITNRLHDHFFYSLHPAAMHLNAILRLRQPRARCLSAHGSNLSMRTPYVCIYTNAYISRKYRMLGGECDGACGSVQKNAPGKINSPLASVAESVYFESAQPIILHRHHIRGFDDESSDMNFVCEFRLKVKSKVADKRIFMRTSAAG